jgi:putative pyruvate formate lyase activating enzyme
MHRQVGPLRFNERGLARRGVLVRHLIMPGGTAGTAEILRWLAEVVSPDTYVNLMDQYRPAGRVSSRDFVEINRGITSTEFEVARELARQGLVRG